MGSPSTNRARRNDSNANPRRYIRDEYEDYPDRRAYLSMVRCPFCDKQMRTQKEPEFRSHLRTECEEAPREVNTDVPDWQDELEDEELAEYVPEHEEESDRSVSERYADEDTPGEVLPV